MGSRFVNTAAGTVDANGNCSLSFPPPPLGMVNTGTVTVYDSLNATVWSLTMAGASIGNTLGTSPAAGIQQYPNEQITVTASQLAPGDQYHATFIGTADLEQNAPPPSFNGGSAQVVTAGAARVAATQANKSIPAFAGPGLPGILSFHVPMFPNERSVVVLIDILTAPGTGANGLTVQVFGDQTGAFYYSNSVTQEQNIPGGNTSGWSMPAVTSPAYGVADSSVNVRILSYISAGPVTVNVTVLAVVDEVLTGSPGNATAVEIYDPTTQSPYAKSDPFPVAIYNGSGNTVAMGTIGQPLSVQKPVVQQVSVQWASTTTVSAVLAGPATGSIRFIDAFNWYTPSPSWVTLDFSNTVTQGNGIYLSGSSGSADFVPRPGIFLLHGQTLYGIAGATGEALTIYYHDENQGTP